jgi:hypothetical protein
VTYHVTHPVERSCNSNSAATKSSVGLEGPHQFLLWVKPYPLPSRQQQPFFIQQVSETKISMTPHGMGLVLCPTLANVEIARKWIHTCQMGLGRCKEPFSYMETDFPPSFRLIDIQRQCITPANNTFIYYALSYVWGRAEHLCLTKANCQELYKEGSLRKLRDRLPLTVQDAMFFASKMNEWFLWVDALCIIQDDEADFTSQVAVMNGVYSSATLTLVAAHGSDANAGLPGLRRGTRKWTNHVSKIQGITLATRPYSWDKTVGKSIWNSRMWTYQERVFSNRLLFFTEQQMYFKCAHGSQELSEDLKSEVQKREAHTWLMDDTGTGLIPKKWAINTLTYTSVVEEYTARNLTNDGDILKAFEGVVKALTPLFRSSFDFGLPRSELDFLSLLVPRREW